MTFRILFIIFTLNLLTFNNKAYADQNFEKQACVMLSYMAGQKWFDKDLSLVSEEYADLFSDNSMEGLNTKQSLHNLYKTLNLCPKILQKSHYAFLLSDAYYFNQRILNRYLEEENHTLNNRLQNKKICPITLEGTLHQYGLPSKNCIYQSPKSYSALIQIQNLGNGIIFKSANNGGLGFMYFNKIDQHLQNGRLLTGGRHQYVGVHEYQSVLGRASLPAFEKLSSDPYNGLLFLYKGRGDEFKILERVWLNEIKQTKTNNQKIVDILRELNEIYTK